MNRNEMQVTEREYKMEVSLRDLSQRGMKLMEELAIKAGTMAFQRVQLDNASQTISDMTWKIEKYEEVMKEAGMKLPDVGTRPDTRVETVDVPQNLLKTVKPPKRRG